MNVFQALRPFVMLVTGVPECIEANPNAPAPKGEYASVLIAQSASPQSRGRLSQVVSEDGRDMTITNRYPVVWEVTVNFWRGDALERAAKLVRAQYLPASSDALLAAGVGIVDCSPVQNLTALQSSNFEPRAVVTLSVTTWEEVSQTVGVIQDVAGSVHQEDGKPLSVW